MTPDSGATPAGAVVFLFTDIEGSTVRWERHPEAMRSAVARHDAVMREAMARHQGTVFKTLGDAFCVAFPEARPALAAAVDAQRALAAEDFSAVDGIRVRMALHAGQADLRGGDYLGPSVIKAGRLMSAAHGRQIILSGVTAELLAGELPGTVSLIDLGPHWLRDLAHPEPILQVAADGLQADFPALRTLVPKPNNLPQPMTSFIGREAEVAELKSLLERYRLVTLVGSGGLGKTRISLKVGGDLLTTFRDGVWLVELAPLTDGQLLGEQVAALFGLRVQGVRSAIDTVVDYLKDKQLLLILDNCEHLVAESARLASDLLRSCPGVRLLASSREGLAVTGEYAYRMPSLTVPPRTDGITAGQALDYGSVRLFVERAQAAVADFRLTDETAPAVAEICRRLDGIALAIELAAPRVRMLHPSALLARLKDRFRLLTGGDRTALPRQQTLRALIDWSYVLLPPEEQVLLQRLAVFGGSWTIEAAAEVVVGGPIADWAVFDLVAALVDKSLAMPVGAGGGDNRYRLLESTREYAMEKLVSSGEADLRRNLAEYLLRLFERADYAWQTTPIEAWLGTYEPDLENVRFALDWCFGADGDATLGATLVARTAQLFKELSMSPELRRLNAQAVAAAAELHLPPAIEGALLLDVSVYGNFGSGRNEETARRAVELLRRSGDEIGLARALQVLGNVLARPGSSEAAEACMREAETILRARAPTKELANILGTLSIVRKFQDDAPGAVALAQEGLAISRRLGHRAGIEFQATNLAEFEFSRGDVRAAISRAREAEAACRRSGNRRFLAYLMCNLGGYLVAAGDTLQAGPAAAEAIRLTRSLGLEREPMICAMEHLALVAALSGDAAASASLLGYGSAWYAHEGKLRDRTEQATYERASGLLDQSLDPEERRRLEAVGAAWSEDQAVAAALSAAGDELTG
ncbi:MAG TPA: adenylate/guanylate cyclase domain-containing protein [Stellaceae bacterium]|nr:adenylate/guanylate cyclase domain-containing protein [Stellaceae bacterium]